MKEKIKKLAIKVVKTMAETALGLIGTSQFVQEVNWIAILSATVLSGGVTILINLKDLKED